MQDRRIVHVHLTQAGVALEAKASLAQQDVVCETQLGPERLERFARRSTTWCARWRMPGSSQEPMPEPVPMPGLIPCTVSRTVLGPIRWNAGRAGTTAPAAGLARRPENGRNQREAAHGHGLEHLGLTDYEFDVTAHEIRNTLYQLGVPRAETEEFMGIIESHRTKVVAN